jgi:prevent-host-death family protein
MEASRNMTTKVEIADAEAHLSELLAKVANGEDVEISRDDAPVAKLTKADSRSKRAEAIRMIRLERAGRPKTTADEILAWRREGQR